MGALVPKGRMRRFVKLAKASAVAGASSLMGDRGEAGLAYAADLLGELRGLGTKAGQMAGYVDGFMPDAQREVYRRIMGKLQTNTAHSPPEEVQALVERELGAPLSGLFESWEVEPFASASIGQVHLARLASGPRLAVKVQHPGIAEAIEQDLTNAASLEGLIAAIAPRGMNVDAVFQEVTKRFREELDYVHEAANLTAFRTLHEHDPSIQIPRVFPERSSLRVLSCVYCHGEVLDEAAGHPESFREHYAETMWRFVSRSILKGGLFNADPHPGNYLFTKDGKVIFLDFGCVQRIGEERRDAARRLRVAALDNDEAAFAQAVRDWFESKGGDYERGAVRFLRLCHQPLFEPEFRFTREFAARVVRAIQELKSMMFVRDSQFPGFPPETVFLNRLQFGFFSVLARLDVTVDYRTEERRILEETA